MSESTTKTEGSETEGETVESAPVSEKTELPVDITDDERRDFERTGSLELYELRRGVDRAAAVKVVLPADITDDERRDFERTGSLELYELRREADKAAREKIRLRQELADAAKAEEMKRVLREQLGKKESTALVLPADANEMEKKDFERTGTLELYELNREGDRIQRERIKLRAELAEKETIEAHKRAMRAQAEMDRLSLEHERKRLAAPPAKDPYADSRPIPGSENLPEVVKGVLRRLFGYGSGEWTEANQIGLVNMLLQMGNHKSQSWAYEMRDALAADVYHSHDLSPQALLRGSTGLKAIAGPLMGELRALAGGGGESLPSLGDERHRRRPKKARDKKKRRDGVVEVEATRMHEPAHNSNDADDDDEDVIDDSPNQEAENAHDPWGEFD